MTTVSVVNMLPTTKKERSDFAERFYDQLESGNYVPSRIHLAIKSASELFKEIMDSDRFKAVAIRDWERQCGATNTLETEEYSAKVGTTWTGYDYLVCRDPYYNRLYREQKRLEGLIKAREEQLKSMPETFDQETGECYYEIENPDDENKLIKVLKPLKTTKEGVKITFK